MTDGHKTMCFSMLKMQLSVHRGGAVSPHCEVQEQSPLKPSLCSCPNMLKQPVWHCF